jgi:hypothetical protein
MAVGNELGERSRELHPVHRYPGKKQTSNIQHRTSNIEDGGQREQLCCGYSLIVIGNGLAGDNKTTDNGRRDESERLSHLRHLLR